MKIIIEGKAKEIAGLVKELQGQLNLNPNINKDSLIKLANKTDIDEVVKELSQSAQAALKESFS